MSKKSIGLLAGIASALFVCGYVTINKYVYTHFQISAIDYSLLFAFVGGFFALLSGLKQINQKVAKEVRTYAPSLLILSVAGFLAVGIFVFGQQYTTTVNAALLVTSTIVATSFFSYILLRDRLNAVQWVWVFVLFVGIYVGIVGLQGITLRAGDIIILASVVLYGFGNAFSRVIMKNMSKPAIVPDVRLFVGGVIAVLIGLFVVKDYSVFIAVLPLAALAGLFYWLCMKAFATAVHLLDANQAIVLNNSQVFFTSIAGVLLLSEDYSIEKLAGAIIVIISIYFITFRKSKVETTQD